MSSFNSTDQTGNPTWDERSHQHDIRPTLPSMLTSFAPQMQTWNQGPVQPLCALPIRPSPAMQAAQIPSTLPQSQYTSPYAQPTASLYPQLTTNPYTHIIASSFTQPVVASPNRLIDTKPETPLNAPVTPRGTKFNEEDNRHVDRSYKFQLGVKDNAKLKLKLRDTTGKKWTFTYPHSDNFDWNDQKHLANVDKWRKQIINRKLTKPKVDAATGAKIMVRPTWSEREKESIKARIAARIQQNCRRLGNKDWIEIAAGHNAAFVGVEVCVGEKLPASLTSAGTFVENGKVSTTHILQERSVNAVYSQVMRWPDIKDMIEKAYSQFNDNDTNSEDEVDSVGEGPSSLGGMDSMSGVSSMGSMSYINDMGMGTGMCTGMGIGGNNGPFFGYEGEEDAVGSPDEDLEYIESPAGTYTRNRTN